MRVSSQFNQLEDLTLFYTYLSVLWTHEPLYMIIILVNLVLIIITIKIFYGIQPYLDVFDYSVIGVFGTPILTFL